MPELKYFEREGLVWRAEIDPESKLILLCLNQYLGANESAWPSVPRIAKDTGLGDKTIRRRLAALKDLGVLAIVARSKNGFKTSNEYTILWDCLRLVGETDRLVTQSNKTGHTVQQDWSHSPTRLVRETDRSDPLDPVHRSSSEEKESASNSLRASEPSEPCPEVSDFPLSAPEVLDDPKPVGGDKNSARPAPRDFFAERCASGGHRYPVLLRVGLGDLWVGPGWNDFDPAIERAAIAHLRKYNLPCERGDAHRYIGNQIRGEQWNKLEILRDEARTIGKPVAYSEPKPQPVYAPPNPEQLAELKRELAKNAALRKAQRQQPVTAGGGL
jgi:hypothetical protein